MCVFFCVCVCMCVLVCLRALVAFGSFVGLGSGAGSQSPPAACHNANSSSTAAKLGNDKQTATKRKQLISITSLKKY